MILNTDEAESKTIVLASHNLSHIFGIADQALYVNQTVSGLYVSRGTE